MFYFLFVCFVKSLEIDLLKLKSHWIGNGVSHFIPGKLQILSGKLKNQCGLMTSHISLPGGSNWQISIKIGLRCKNSAELALGLFFTSRSSLQFNKDYSCEKYKSAFGMSSSIQGFGVTLHNDSIHSKSYNSTILNQEEFLKGAKICRALFKPESKELSIIVRKESSSLTVFQFDTKTGKETNCGDFASEKSMSKFYFTTTGYDIDGNCDVRVHNARLTTKENVQFSDAMAKTRSDNKFAYFDENTLTKIDNTHFHKAQDYERQNAKIIAQELLHLADKNEKEVIADLKKEYKQFAFNITQAIGIIEKEAQQISTLSHFLQERTKNNSASKLNYVSLLLRQIEILERNYQDVETYSEKIYKTFKRLDVFMHLDELNYQSESLIDEVGMLINRARKLINNSAKSRGSQREVSFLKESLQKFAGNVFNSLSEHHEKSNNSISSLFLFTLGGIFILIVLSYTFLYWKMKKTSEFKRLI